jgi:hypothetical protein
VTTTKQGAAKSAATLNFDHQTSPRVARFQPGTRGHRSPAACGKPIAVGSGLRRSASKTSHAMGMRLVLINRLANNPDQFLAQNAKSVADINRAPNQFEEFSDYPKVSATITKNLTDILAIANNDTHPKQAVFIDHVRFAISVAADPPVSDPCPGKLYGWRTKGASSPGPRFDLFESIGGNDFYTLK